MIQSRKGKEREKMKEKMKKGIWLVTFCGSKLVIDYENRLFDDYKNYKKYGILETELGTQAYNCICKLMTSAIKIK